MIDSVSELEDIVIFCNKDTVDIEDFIFDKNGKPFSSGLNLALISN